MYSYRSVAAEVRTKINVGACRFYASLAPCANEAAAKAFLQQVKGQLPGATHHATACRLGWGAELRARCNDDGEPAGTAGPPLLAVLEKAELTNVMLIATRYFGGVKLGIGGLIRAYRACGEAGVKEALICEQEITVRLELKVPYTCLGAVEREIKARGAEVLRHRFAQQVSLDIIVPLRIMDSICERITSVSRGEAILRRLLGQD